MIFKQRRVRRLARKCWWDGFFAGLGGMPRDPGLFHEGPRWWQDVKEIASSAGVRYAEELIAERKQKKPNHFPERDIPADVLAECYAAASR